MKTHLQFQRVNPFPSWWEAWHQVGRHDAATVSENFHLTHKQGVERETGRGRGRGKGREKGKGRETVPGLGF